MTADYVSRTDGCERISLVQRLTGVILQRQNIHKSSNHRITRLQFQHQFQVQRCLPNRSDKFPSDPRFTAVLPDVRSLAGRSEEGFEPGKSDIAMSDGSRNGLAACQNGAVDPDAPRITSDGYMRRRN